VQAVLDGASASAVVQAGAILGLLLSVLAFTLARLEFGAAARRRQRARQQLEAAERQRRAAVHQARIRAVVEDGELTPAELARLEAFRPRARLMADEPTGIVAWWRKVQLIWHGGHAGWIVACLLGSFSMATHFGAFWLITGGGWPGAIVVTVLSTAAMVACCAWVMLGLIGRH
jgi:hypothetical protein